MMKIEMTYHASVERVDRLAACVEHLGMSKFVIEVPDRKYKGTKRCLTSTGIMMIISQTTGELITGWMASPAQVCSLYAGKRVPQKLYNRVVKNNQMYAFLQEL